MDGQAFGGFDREPRASLYRPDFEHDACGVGLIANMRGGRSHGLIDQGIEILKRLEHRGASGSEPNTGDGAGVTIQMPHAFMAREAARLGIVLPDPYAVAMVFLPRDAADRAACCGAFERAVGQAGQGFLGWRDVPTDNTPLGGVARGREPFVRQAFIGPGAGVADQTAFERRLYVARQIATNAIGKMALRMPDTFYVPSMSARTICYKGHLLASQIPVFYPDLADRDVDTALVLVHQRYSTNTFPSWNLAHPFRYLCHNGEINTLRGNINWMKARESLFRSELFGDDIQHILPVFREGQSDSAVFDNALELLVQTGRSLPHAAMMLIPEAWEHHETMPEHKKAFYEYHLSLMEPWDGPALIAFTDGSQIGALLDRNGLRPARYVVTDDDVVILSSEVGVLPVSPEKVVLKGRLQPGRMLLVDVSQGRIIDDEEIKDSVCKRRPYGEWLARQRVRLEDLPRARVRPKPDPEQLLKLQKAFGYTLEHLRMIIAPMAENAQEPVGSMGDDTPLAVLSDQPRMLYDYFKQLFAQVTNPPLDAIREEIVTSLRSNLGAEGDLFQETPEHCRQLVADQPVLIDEELERVRTLDMPGLRAATISTLVEPGCGAAGLRAAMDRVCAQASGAIRDDRQIIILSDRGADATHMPIPALLACAGVHHHLIREGTRTRVGLIIESGEPREVHHFSLLIGYGAGAVNPYLALATIDDMASDGYLGDLACDEAGRRYAKAAAKGVLKVMSKMGISTLQSYRGAQIFEAVGLNSEVVDAYFTRTPSRIQGIGLDVIAEEATRRHRAAFSDRQGVDADILPTGGAYQWMRDGERHLFTPESIAKLQYAVRHNDRKAYRDYAALINDQARRLSTLRGMFRFRSETCAPVPLEEVEPASEIVRRFKTGAMSFGSISKEAHETMAVAMNRIGGKSNSGEGGEDPERFKPRPNGDSACSAIKQVASGRFGVTGEYLVSARELQIKMAQGAKPGEGGQLPGHKVSDRIAKVRHSTPGVQLISPPPHHDIYSIEDLAQLIYDLKCANAEARINVKLVAEVGVGTVAAGVSKGHADVVLISGYDGGTGASPISSIKHAGLPWELGLAETQQTLVLNDLRGRIVVECDGQMKTGRDVAIACLLGAEEFGFASAALVSMGCLMLRNCHLDTCSVGIATQDPKLRKCFAGKPVHVANFMYFVAEEIREIMASLGFRSIDEMVGRCDLLETSDAIKHWKAEGLDLTPILTPPQAPPAVARRCVDPQDHGMDRSFDARVLLPICEPAIERGERVEAELEIGNVDRAAGATVGSRVSKRWGGRGLPEDTIRLTLHGSAGQSFGAFCPRGMTLTVEGEANDHFGKGLSGARLIVKPPAGSRFVPEDNIIVGNVTLYGATSGEAYIRGVAGERFCVRNSGATAVVEGIGDHGCEYMTGGRVVVLGPTGRNFAAGMSGGIAYILDDQGDFDTRCNREMVDLESVTDSDEAEWLRTAIERHVDLTGSGPGQRILADWPEAVGSFVKVFPKDYKRALAERGERTDRAERERTRRPKRSGVPAGVANG